MIYDTVIIGGGPAGYTAALYCARAGLSVAVVEKMSAGGQMTLTGEIDNYPGFPNGIDGFTLGMNMEQGAARFGAQTLYDQVETVNLSGRVKEITTLMGNTLQAKTVILAMGANPRPLGLAGEETALGRGIHYCAHCDGRFYKDKIVAVVGGGNSAVQDALYLAGLCKQVFLIHRRDTLRAEKIYHAPLQAQENVTLLWNSAVTAFTQENGKFQGITLQNLQTQETTSLACDGLFVSIGRAPATDFVNDLLPLDPAGYIMADETTQTPIPGVYAVGDVRTKPLRQVVTAVADGATAAHFVSHYLDLLKA